ncbi:MAG: TatD family deoxyribonuclease [Chloroflexi bacterium]|nr:MAG: TatD family deoxyribonuclease [Chloroflexota bacterium]
MLIDTHCHVHEASYPLAVDQVKQRALENNVRAVICVGTSEQSSAEAVAFAQGSDWAYSSIGVHPHDTKDGYDMISTLAVQSPDRLVAIGEIGLDYFYTHSPRDIQIKALESQLQTAMNADLPVIFHVREAFDDFWPIFDNFTGLCGVLHSFTDTQVNVEAGLMRGLYIGLNGISTFTKDIAQQTLFRSIPLDRVLLETDSPFLTPVPKRGTVNEPAFVTHVASHHANSRGISFETVAQATTANAQTLFSFNV